MAKINHHLRETLSQLKDWAEIELRIAEHAEARKAWRDVAEWADGVAASHKITLSKTFSSAADGPTGDGGLGRRKPHYASAATFSPHGADGPKPKGQALA